MSKRVYLRKIPQSEKEDINIEYVKKRALELEEFGELKHKCSDKTAAKVALLKKEKVRQHEKLTKEMQMVCEKPLKRVDRIAQELEEAHRDLARSQQKFLAQNPDRVRRLEKVMRDLNDIYSDLYAQYMTLSKKSSQLSAADRTKVLKNAQRLIESVVIQTKEERDKIEAFKTFFSRFGELQMCPEISMDAPLAVLI
jgi:hypothetical protein